VLLREREARRMERKLHRAVGQIENVLHLIGSLFFRTPFPPFPFLHLLLEVLPSVLSSKPFLPSYV
jgi:hypothetical protein